VTNTQDKSKLYGGPDLKYQRAKKGTEHMIDIERSYMFGEKRSTTVTAGQPKRFTGGVHELLGTGGSFVQNQGGVLTAPDFNNFLREGFTYGNPQKVLMAGGYVLQAVNEFARGQLQTQVGSSKYGLAISKYQTPFGEINIVHNPLFIGDVAGYAYLLDLESFRSRYLDGRDTSLKMNIQANDVDGRVDEYLSECGLERKQAPRHALLKGVLPS